MIAPSLPPQLVGAEANEKPKVGVGTIVRVKVAASLIQGDKSVVHVRSTVPAAVAIGPGV